MGRDRYFLAEEYADPDTVAEIPHEFEAYISWRVLGYPAIIAARKSFSGIRNQMAESDIARCVERNPFVINGIIDKVNNMELSDVWNHKLAAFECLKIIRDPYSKETARVSAIKELNAIMNVTGDTGGKPDEESEDGAPWKKDRS